jgi:hypothetical protein
MSHAIEGRTTRAHAHGERALTLTRHHPLPARPQALTGWGKEAQAADPTREGLASWHI